MGSGASTKPKQSSRVINNLAKQDPIRPKSPSHQTITDTPNSPTPGQRPRGHKRPRTDERDWPLPTVEFVEDFIPTWPIERDRYSITRAYQIKASAIKKLKLSDERPPYKEFHQKETSVSQWKHQNSSISHCAHVQSSLQTQSHACINLSTTQEIDELITSLTTVQKQLELNIEDKGRIISEQLREIIDTIVRDTRDMQQSLLGYAKTQQTLQDEHYNRWLQKYVTELDKWKSERLAELQGRMQKYQQNIMEYSQSLIMDVNQEANQLRDQVLKTEQASAAQMITDITKKIQEMSTHHLGTETMTKINLIVHGNVGTKLPGQECKFDFDSPSAENGLQSTSSVKEPKAGKH